MLKSKRLLPLSINMPLLVPPGRGPMPDSYSTNLRRPATTSRSLAWAPYLLVSLLKDHLEDMELLHDLLKEEAEECLAAEDPLVAVVS
jgi:hypothetical protein